MDIKTDKEYQDLEQLRKKALAYYQMNGVPQIIETALNKMFFSQPNDPFSYLTQYFTKYLHPPLIEKVSAIEIFDSKGQPTVSAEILINVNGLLKSIGAASIASYNQLTDASLTEKKEADDEERQKSVTAAIEYINGPMSTALKGCLVSEQSKIDQILGAVLNQLQQHTETLESPKTTPAPPKDEPKQPVPNKGSAKAAKKKDAVKTPEACEAPKEVTFCGAQAVSAVSAATAIAAATCRSMAPFEYINELFCKKTNESFRLPTPMITMLSGGRSVSGKQNLIRELLLIPKPGIPISEVVAKCKNVFNRLISDLSRKLGAVQAVSKVSQLPSRVISDVGSLSPAFDRPEQLLESLLEACQPCDVTLGEDFFVGLHCASHEYWDSSKERYEFMTGTFKSSDELVDSIYSDLIQRFPFIIAVIDPFVQQDLSAWQRFSELHSHRMWIFGERSLGRPEQILLEAPKIMTNGGTFQFNQSTSVFDLIDVSRDFKEKEFKTMVTTSLADTTDTFIVDLAVGIEADFIKIGGFCRGERTSKYNRLLAISNDSRCLPPISKEQWDFKSLISTDIAEESEESEPVKE